MLNIIGLTIAFTCALLVLLFVRYEFSYDNYHKNAENVFRVVKEDLDNEWRGTNMWNATSGLLKPTILENCPEAINGVRILKIWEVEIIKGNQHFLEEEMAYVEPQFFELFSYAFVNGDPTTALNHPKSLVLTESLASKYFPGEADPVGKSILISGIDFIITGILKDIPANSHFPIGFLGSYQTLFDPAYNLYDSQLEWNNNNYATYIQLQKNTEPRIVEDKITGIVKEIKGNNSRESYHLQNIRDIHLYSDVNLEAGTNGNILYVSIFSGIAILLLIIGGFNYMNLTSAQLMFYTKETGIRKIIGASKTQVLLQILGEAILISFISLVLSIFITQLILPFFSQFVERQLTSDMLLDPNLITFWFVLILIYAVLTSLYPAIQILRQNPVKVLKSNKITSRETIGIRNSLIVIQFAISITLIAGTIILYQQLNYIKNKELGFQKENVVNIQIPDMNSELKKKYGTLKNELAKIPDVLDITYAQTALDKDNWGGGADWNGKPPEVDIPMYHLIVENNYLDFYGIELLYGQSFSEEMKAEGRTSYFILNEAAVKAIGWTDPVNRDLSMQMWSDSRVIGVVKDFHYQPLHLGIEPLAISLGSPDRHANIISVKIKPENLSVTLNQLESSYQNIFPGHPFRYHFLDEQLDISYRTDQKLGKIFGVLAGISIMVAALGLFGIASFLAKQRIKEIGIRKVNGAKTSEILTLLNRDFIKWVIVAFIIATPIAWYSMNQWLQSFAYKAELSWWIFAMAGLMALGIALLTVSWQSWKAASRNPVEALRYE